MHVFGVVFIAENRTAAEILLGLFNELLHYIIQRVVPGDEFLLEYMAYRSRVPHYRDDLPLHLQTNADADQGREVMEGARLIVLQGFTAHDETGDDEDRSCPG